MIVNARKTLSVVVEIDEHDLERLVKGEDIYKRSYADGDEAVLVQVYSSNPGVIGTQRIKC